MKRLVTLAWSARRKVARFSVMSAGSGSVVVFSSVAGVRVRRANYVYGSAKAGLQKSTRHKQA